MKFKFNAERPCDFHFYISPLRRNNWYFKIEKKNICKKIAILSFQLSKFLKHIRNAESFL